LFLTQSPRRPENTLKRGKRVLDKAPILKVCLCIVGGGISVSLLGGSAEVKNSDKEGVFLPKSITGMKADDPGGSLKKKGGKVLMNEEVSPSPWSSTT